MQKVPDYLEIARRARKGSSDEMHAEGLELRPTPEEDRRIERLIAEGMSPRWARAEILGWHDRETGGDGRRRLVEGCG